MRHRREFIIFFRSVIIQIGKENTRKIIDDCSRKMPILELLYNMHGGCAEYRSPIEPKTEPEDEENVSNKESPFASISLEMSLLKL